MKRFLCGAAAFLMVILFAMPLLRLPALAADPTQYIYDEIDLLTEEQWSTLQAKAKEISDRYQFGVYIIIVDDYRDYGSKEAEGIWDVATYIWNSEGLGYGSGHEGSMLMISMDDRDYDNRAFGPKGEVATTDYGLLYIEDNYFFNDLKRNNWYGACNSYLEGIKYLLEQYEAGTPIDGEVDYDAYGGNGQVKGISGGEAVISVAGSAGVAGAACAVMAGKNKSVRKATGAAYYAVPRSMVLYDQRDVFTHTTQSRVRIETERSSGGGSHGGSFHSGGGGHGHSGKF